MVATWLTELLLDTLNRALLQQGAGADEVASSSGAGATNGAAAADGDGGNSNSSYHQVSLQCPICSPHASPACCHCYQHHLLPTRPLLLPARLLSRLSHKHCLPAPSAGGGAAACLPAKVR
jgi:hypothetical protein